jgi:hypothetical protein
VSVPAAYGAELNCVYQRQLDTTENNEKDEIERTLAIPAVNHVSVSKERQYLDLEP